jgi:hypothetical protein
MKRLESESRGLVEPRDFSANFMLEMELHFILDLAIVNKLSHNGNLQCSQG